jgi:hypothetical protein
MEERIIKDFGSMGKLRLRLLETKTGPALDVREYVEAANFEGFTRRGIRLNMAEAAELAHVINRIYDQGGNPRPAPAPMAVIATDYRPVSLNEARAFIADAVTTPQEVKTMTADELQAAYDGPPTPAPVKSWPCFGCGGPVKTPTVRYCPACIAAEDARQARQVANLPAPPVDTRPAIVVRTGDGKEVNRVILPTPATPKTPRTSVLPPALLELRERMRRGETVSLSELAEAMKGMKPKQL